MASRRSESSWIRGRRAAGMLGLFVVSAGCGGGADPPAPPPEDDEAEEGGSDGGRDEALDALRTLGYVDFSDEEADESLQGVVHHDRDRAYPGYNLYNHAALSKTWLIDMDGRVVHSWEHNRGDAYCELLPNGDLLLPGIELKKEGEGDDLNRRLLRMSWEGEVIWMAEITAHHDVEVTPDDRILTLSFEPAELPIHPDGTVRENPLTLVTQGGEVIEKLPLYEVLGSRPDLFQLSTEGATVRDNAKRTMDLYHANSIEWMHHEHLESKSPIYAPTNVLISMRHQNAAVIINWETEQLVWAWGPGEVLGPHDATMLESGNVLLFDNGRGRGWSRVVEIDPLSNEIVWEYKAPEPADFYTLTRGSSQRLPNGNTLVTNSNSGQVFEVTPEGEIVWDYYTPHMDDRGHRAAIVRMKRYERGFIEPLLR